MDKMKSNDYSKCWWRGRAAGSVSHAGQVVQCAATLGNMQEGPSNMKHELRYDPVILHRKVYTIEMKLRLTEKPVSKCLLFFSQQSQTGNSPEGLPRVSVNNLWHKCTVEPDSQVKRTKLLTCANNWIELCWVKNIQSPNVTFRMMLFR